MTRDKLYYYDNELGDAGGGGSGIIHLECFLDCVEAPLTDHKKATNVFILLAKERGLFEQVIDWARNFNGNFMLMLHCSHSNILFESQFYCLLLQGRYYLSAETLKDMKNWVLKIRTAIRNLNKMKDAKTSLAAAAESGPSSMTHKMEASSNEPEYASIKDYPRYF